jgi:hypothetical protein
MNSSLVDDPALIRSPWDTTVWEYKWYPFPFLRADKKLLKPKGKYTARFGEQVEDFSEGYPWNRAAEFSTGLYFINTKTLVRADGCKLLLPYPINSQEFARCGDMKVINNPQKHDGLYQPGDRLIELEDRTLRFELLFINWTYMVENGHWGVDENGVTGGIEKFKEADSQEKWNLYWIKRTW